jgi:DNA-directed RNA polymerase subunit RPC12/RpoP
MIPPAFSNPSESTEEHDFEQLIQDAITAVKQGDRSRAVKLFEEAAMIDDTDVRIWIWMSATTDDLEERRKYLEHAVSLDPSNETARRGLSFVEAKLTQPPPAPAPEAPAVVSPAPATIKQAAGKTYTCPNCGATISYAAQDTVLVCQFCGFTRKVNEEVVRDSKDQATEQASPAAPPQRWADHQSKVTCEQCGVVILLPAGQTADSCPYCSSNRFTPAPSLQDMADPQVIGLFKIDPDGAAGHIRDWLGKGLLSPDNLAAEHAGMQLHPAYYPFWLFEGRLEIPWFGDVNMGTTRQPQWEAHGGNHFEDFKDVLIPGLRKLSASVMAGIAPFNLDDLVVFSAEQLADGMALIYDTPVADASIAAREKVIQRVLRSITRLVEPSHAKRNFSTGEAKWSDLSSKLALLPIYTGNYFFQGKHYRLLVNGQTGKVGGKKPVDRLKLVMFVVIGFILLVVLLVILLMIGRAIGG